LLAIIILATVYK